MSAHITGINNPNSNSTIAMAIENNMKALPLVREEYYLTIENFNKLNKDISFIANDISFLANVSVSGDLIPLNSVTSDLGSSTNYWANAYINDISVINISISGNLEPLYVNTSKLGNINKYWSNAYINDISANNISVTNISISGNVTIPDESITSSHI